MNVTFAVSWVASGALSALTLQMVKSDAKTLWTWTTPVPPALTEVPLLVFPLYRLESPGQWLAQD